MTDPYTGNFWINSQSCPLYCFRLEDNYSQIISPALPGALTTPTSSRSSGSPIVGDRSVGVRARSRPVHLANVAYLYLIPREITDRRQRSRPTISCATPRLLIPTCHGRTLNSNLYPAYNREIFDHSGNMYLFSCSPSAERASSSTSSRSRRRPLSRGPGRRRLHRHHAVGRFDRPQCGRRRLHARKDDQRHRSPVVETPDVIPLYLPGTDDLVLISKFFPKEHTPVPTIRR
jgi:hypothetical protein